MTEADREIIALLTTLEQMQTAGGEIPMTTNLLVGDGTGNAHDSGIPKSSIGASTVVYHANGTSTAYPPSANTDLARGTALLTAAATLVSGDLLQISGGTFNLNGVQCVIPDGTISVRGAGIDVTIIIIGSDLNTGYGILKPGTGSVISDLTVDESANPANQTVPVGFKSTAGDTVPTSFMLIRVKAVGNHDCFRFYSGGTAFDATLIDCVLRGSWDGLTCATTSSSTIKVFNPDFVCVANPDTNAIHALSPAAATLTVVGGKISASGSTVNNYGIASSGNLTTSSTVISTSGTGAFDLYNAGSGSFLVSGGSGSGTNGVFTTSGTITFVKPVIPDDTTTPINSVTPIGYINLPVGGTKSWVPYYQ